jgi:hypothetical protein
VNILFFIPHFKFWNQTLVLNSLIKHLGENNKVFVLACNQDMEEHCMVFNAAGLSILGQQKKSVKYVAAVLAIKIFFKARIKILY